jgi:RNA polymerase sigma-70 factor (ECF subfamily)
MDSEGSGISGQFSTTRWSLVLLAGQTLSPAHTMALEHLCRAYWQPICAFARRKGWSEEDAKDLTQQFFADLLARNGFHGLGSRRGKFRTFLLTAFTHFLANEYDRVTAQKRGGGQALVSLDQFPAEALGGIPPAEALPPELHYDFHWAQAVLAAALQHLKSEISPTDQPGLFDVLKPFLTASAGADEYALVAGKLGVKTSSIPVRIHRLRQRYRELVRAEVAQTVSSPLELEEEMRHLFAVLNR